MELFGQNLEFRFGKFIPLNINDEQVFEYTGKLLMHELLCQFLVLVDEIQIVIDGFQSIGGYRYNINLLHVFVALNCFLRVFEELANFGLEEKKHQLDFAYGV